MTPHIPYRPGPAPLPNTKTTIGAHVLSSLSPRFPAPTFPSVLLHALHPLVPKNLPNTYRVAKTQAKRPPASLAARNPLYTAGARTMSTLPESTSGIPSVTRGIELSAAAIEKSRERCGISGHMTPPPPGFTWKWKVNTDEGGLWWLWPSGADVGLARLLLGEVSVSWTWVSKWHFF